MKLPQILPSCLTDKEIVAHIVKLKSRKQAGDEGSVNVYRTVKNVKYEEINIIGMSLAFKILIFPNFLSTASNRENLVPNEFM